MLLLYGVLDHAVINAFKLGEKLKTYSRDYLHLKFCKTLIGELLAYLFATNEQQKATKMKSLATRREMSGALILHALSKVNKQKVCVWCSHLK